MTTVTQVAGAYRIKHNGQLSTFSAPTRSKAEAYRDKLVKGFVRFEPYTGPRERPVNRLPFQCMNARAAISF